MDRLKILLLTVAVSVHQVTSQDSTDESPVKISRPKITVNPAHVVLYNTETVTLRCEVPGELSGLQYVWYKNSADLGEHQPSITARGSGNYECKAKKGASASDKSDSYTLTLTDPPKAKLTANPDLQEFFPNEEVNLQCQIEGGSSGWTFYWTRNEWTSEINGDLKITVQQANSGEYSCKGQLNGRQVTSQQSNKFQLNVRELPEPQIQSDWTEAFLGEKVSLQCVIQDDSKNWNYLWFKDSKKININGNPLTRSVKSSHNGAYECQAELQGRKVMTAKSTPHSLTVHELPQPKLSIESQWNTFYPTEEVTLKCSVSEDSNKWGYEWFKNGAQLQDKDISLSGNTLFISSAKAGHSGQYTCRGKHLTRTSVTTTQTQAVRLQINDNTPKPSITKRNFKFFYTEEQVQLYCNMPEDGWEYYWYKDKENLRNTNSKLTIESASVANTGHYHCKVQRGDFSVDSETVEVQVQKPPEPQIQSDYTDAFHGEKVSLLCVNQDVSQNWNYLWFKGSDKIVSNDKTNINGNILTLSVESSHNGAYQCQAKLEGRKVMTAKSTPYLLTVHGPQPTLVLEQDPSDSEIYTEEQVELNCRIKEKTSQWIFLWRKDSAEVKVQDHIYTIPSADLSHDGTYTCQVERKETKFLSKDSKKLTIKERPQPKLSLESQWTMFYPNEKVTLKCSINEDSKNWGYDWFKNGAQLKDEGISLSGNTLFISSSKADHSGQYTCRGKYLKRTSVTTGLTKAVQLHINDTTPDVTITKHEWFDLFYTEEQVQLHCNMPGDGWKYHWHKDSNPLTTKPEFTINSVSLTDTGDYHCEAKRGEFSVDSETLQVRVKACPPASLSLETELSDIMTGDVTLRCNVSDGRQWNYTWFMNGQQLNESSNVLKVTGNEETIQSEFKCKGINTERPLYSALSDGFTANNIIFKRKILLAISGCLVCCIVILIIGCIVLKITRKPEVKEAAPEDLFFSMTDSKNQTVSPMKEYMDNRPTELEECQEKEELITDRASAVHEDGVIKDEATSASETNGLMSFKGN
ncbi:Fc receptor-like protein 5 [Garra rufa]|uniref:Fc receptor-like protein 5 n=1 Tax=Garra rufa TaxID=137080 RepID=UPI003CCE8366